MCLAVPTRIQKIEGETAMCKVHGGDTQVEASLLLLDEEVTEGDYILLHAGFALRKLDQDEAAETLALFRELAENIEDKEYIQPR